MNRPEPIRQAGLLMVLATGMDDSTTLLQGLKALAMESKPPWSDRVMHLRLLLEQGRTLTEALSLADGLLPDPTMVAIRVGEETGTLKQVLAEEAHRLMNVPTSSSPVHASATVTAWWIVAIALAAVGIVSFIMVFIIPKFKKIFEDFGMDLPQLTNTLISISDWVMNFWWLLLLPAVTLIGVPAWQLSRMHRDFVTRGQVRYSEHFPTFWTPLILRLLSIAVAAGTSLNDGIHAILKELPPGRAAEKLSAVRLRMRSGFDCWDSMEGNGFLNQRNAAFLISATRTRHLEWALMHLSRSLERRRSVWAQRIIGLVQPLIVLLVGLVVGFVCVALFAPLLKLLNDLS